MIVEHLDRIEERFDAVRTSLVAGRPELVGPIFLGQTSTSDEEDDEWHADEGAEMTEEEKRLEAEAMQRDLEQMLSDPMKVSNDEMDDSLGEVTSEWQ
jgi:hypothetical protein